MAYQDELPFKDAKEAEVFSAELEVIDSRDSSAFDKSMDDLLYLLNNSGCDVVVFEDLDRFGKISIFEKLRSINSLANASRQPSENVLRFVYLIHDGLFQDSHDRTKFFDYIIPVIPYADTSNAFDLLKSGLKGVEVEPDDRFLRGLSVFIDDPRILNAIVDETYHYGQALQRSQGKLLDAHDAKQLVSIIAYKETFPSDFELLQVGRGYMHALIYSRERLVENEMKNIEVEKGELKEKIRQSDDEVAHNEQELVLLFQTSQVAQMFVRTRNTYPTSFTIDGFNSPDELVSAIDANPNYSSQYEKIREDLSGNPDFTSRLDAIKAKSGDERSRIELKMQALDKRQAELRRAPLSELFKDESFYYLQPDDLPRPADYEELHFESVKRSPYFGMIPFLISVGGIDESYERYTSNFYPTSLTRMDRDFVMAILGGRSDTDPDYVLGSPEAVVLCMDETCLSRKCARNRSLLKALAESGEPSQVAAFISGVEIDCDAEFLMGYLTSDQYTPKVFPFIHEGAMGTVEVMLEADDSAGMRDRRIMMHRILAEGGSVRDDPRVATRVKAAAESDEKFLAAGKSQAIQVADGLESIGYSAEEIDFSASDAELIEEVFARRLFAPNAVLVSGFLGHFGVSEEETRFSRLVDSVIYADVIPDPELFRRYVNENMERFASSLAAIPDVEIDASEEAVSWVMNADRLTDETASLFAACMTGRPVANIALITPVSKLSALFSNDRVVANADNILGYYAACSFEADDALIGFLERNEPPSDLNLLKSRAVLGEDNVFLEDLMKSNMEATSFGNIANGYGAVYPAFDIAGIDEGKVSVLIKTGAIPLTAHNLQFVRAEYRPLAVKLASCDPDAYVALVIGDKEGAVLPFSEDEVLEAFESPRFPASSKLRLLDGFSTPVRLKDEYPTSLLIAICTTRFSQEDLSSLPKFYASNEPDLRRAVLMRASKSYKEMMSLGVNMPWSMVADMMKDVTAEDGREAALSMISWQLSTSKLSEKHAARRELKKCFSSAGQGEYVKLLEGTRVQVPDTRADQIMVDELESIGLCTVNRKKLSSAGKIIVHPKGYSRSEIGKARS